MIDPPFHVPSTDLPDDSSVNYSGDTIATTINALYDESGIDTLGPAFLIDYAIPESILIIKIRELEQRVTVLEDILFTEYKEYPLDILKEKILQHVEENGVFWPDELADELNADPFEVVAACEELVTEGRLKGLDPKEVPR